MIALIDADIILYRVAWAKKDETEEEVVENYLDEYFTTLQSSTGCSQYIGYLTGRNNFRYELAVSLPYKGNRVKKEKPVWKDFLRNVLINKYHCIVVDGMEADDALSITQRVFMKDNIPCFIASTDKDLLQIQGEHFNFVKQLWTSVSDLDAAKNLWTQVLTGDLGTDNIPGLPGIGTVKAGKIIESVKYPHEEYRTAVLNEYVRCYGEYDGIQKFTENFMLIKLLETKEDFLIPAVCNFK